MAVVVSLCHQENRLEMNSGRQGGFVNMIQISASSHLFLNLGNVESGRICSCSLLDFLYL